MDSIVELRNTLSVLQRLVAETEIKIQEVERRQLPIDHRSASAANGEELQGVFLDQLSMVGDGWIPFHQLIVEVRVSKGIEVWSRWGKDVVESTLLQMASCSLVELKISDSGYRKLRLTPRGKSLVESLRGLAYAR